MATETELVPPTQDDLIAAPRTGRPTKYSRQTAERLLYAIRIGEFIEAACAAAGLSRSVLYVWLKQGNEAERLALAKWHALPKAKQDKLEALALAARQQRALDAQAANRPIDLLEETPVCEAEPYALLPPRQAELGRFLYAYGLSLHECDLRMVANINLAAKKDWRAARYLLQQRHPTTWGRRRLELTGLDGGPIAIKPVGVYLPANGRPDTAPALPPVPDGEDHDD